MKNTKRKILNLQNNSGTSVLSVDNYSNFDKAATRAPLARQISYVSIANNFAETPSVVSVSKVENTGSSGVGKYIILMLVLP